MTDAAPTASPLPHPTHRNWVWRSFQFFFRNVFTLFLRYRARGIEKIPEEGGGLILVNHQSFLDPLLVGLPLHRPVSYLARDTLFPIPFIGWVLRSTYVMPINRDAAGTESVREAVRRMQHGFLVGVFPEGTRCRDGSIGEFKPGFIALARRGKLPIYPVAISGAHKAMPRGKLWLFCREVRVIFGDPIPADEVARLARKGNEHELLAVVRQRIQDCLDEADRWRLEGN